MFNFIFSDMDKTSKIEVRDFGCSRYRENSFLSTIAREIDNRKRERIERAARERRKRDLEMSLLSMDIAMIP